MALTLPFSLLAHGLYSSLVNAISAITIGTGKLIKSLYTHQNPDVTKLIHELDIDRRLKLVQTLLNAAHRDRKSKISDVKMDEIEKSKIYGLMNCKCSDDEFDDPIELCLGYLHDIIQQIHRNLVDIEQKVIRHKKKWFNSWRKLNVKSLLDNLKLNSLILDARFNDLIKVSEYLSRK